jgi:hypothetical protein
VEFTKEDITKEPNADVRREIIRKIGAAQLLKVLDYKVIDSFEGYELITFDIGDGRVRPFLKMQNPSMDLTHVEGVRPGISAVKEALCYRNGLESYTAPLALS